MYTSLAGIYTDDEQIIQKTVTQLGDGGKDIDSAFGSINRVA